MDRLRVIFSTGLFFKVGTPKKCPETYLPPQKKPPPIPHVRPLDLITPYPMFRLFEWITEAIGWLRIVASPLLIGLAS
jgi:hypothetical protein